MKTPWMNDYAMEKPELLEKAGKSYIQRRNIVKKKDENGNVIGYEFERRFLSEEDYQDYQEQLEFIRSVMNDMK